jgi:hypothetical protein
MNYDDSDEIDESDLDTSLIKAENGFKSPVFKSAQSTPNLSEEGDSQTV